ncbi:MAG: molecular chaperone TorD family protein [Pirellulaceae bacterium]|jgi:TorA maturation chaperone TorD|nr:molecular chaperone TorD family protein [Pirellulaceae bacterium]
MTSTTTNFDPALNFARQSLYRFTALSLLDPRAGSWEQLNELRDDRLLQDAAELIRDEPAAAAASLAVGELALEDLNPAAALAALPTSQSALNDEFERTFGLLVSNACPPYETEYIDGKFAFQRSQALADVSGFYHAFGLAPSTQRPDRPDHVVLELEFMSFLIGMERGALEGDSADHQERAAICRDAQQQFLREHLSWWAPAFSRLLARENGDGFYAAVANLLAAWVAAERSLLGVEAPNQTAQPSTLERPEECEGCVLAADAPGGTAD